MKSFNILNLALATCVSMTMVSCQIFDESGSTEGKVVNKPLPKTPHAGNPYAPSLNSQGTVNSTPNPGSGFFPPSTDQPSPDTASNPNNLPVLPGSQTSPGPIDQLNPLPTNPNITGNTQPSGSTLPPPPPTSTKTNYSYAVKIPNSPGWVYSPHTNKRVDVSNIASGRLVEDPTAPGKRFRVP